MYLQNALYFVQIALLNLKLNIFFDMFLFFVEKPDLKKSVFYHSRATFKEHLCICKSAFLTFRIFMMHAIYIRYNLFILCNLCLTHVFRDLLFIFVKKS